MEVRINLFWIYLIIGISNGVVPGKSDTDTGARNSLLILGSIFVVSLLGLSYVYMMFPELDE